MDRVRVVYSHHARLTKMLVEFFRSGTIDSRPSSKCGTLFVCLSCWGWRCAIADNADAEVDEIWMDFRRNG